eukprot:TRINITY_DN35738_c0_g1_i2.p1 TRINITY_DN35738_c0_g1~~TRINITY_DN35738_c0_g1_i2.p1  ORF type:complete len:309 (+),score=97.46 TRINITY_DN35738_c0_g1_i2:83-1009(+)
MRLITSSAILVKVACALRLGDPSFLADDESSLVQQTQQVPNEAAKQLIDVVSAGRGQEVVVQEGAAVGSPCTPCAADGLAGTAAGAPPGLGETSLLAQEVAASAETVATQASDQASSKAAAAEPPVWQTLPQRIQAYAASQQPCPCADARQAFDRESKNLLGLEARLATVEGWAEMAGYTKQGPLKFFVEKNDMMTNEGGRHESGSSVNCLDDQDKRLSSLMALNPKKDKENRKEKKSTDGPLKKGEKNEDSLEERKKENGQPQKAAAEEDAAEKDTEAKQGQQKGEKKASGVLEEATGTRPEASASS